MALLDATALTLSLLVLPDPPGRASFFLQVNPACRLSNSIDHSSFKTLKTCDVGIDCWAVARQASQNDHLRILLHWEMPSDLSSRNRQWLEKVLYNRQNKLACSHQIVGMIGNDPSCKSCKLLTWVTHHSTWQKGFWAVPLKWPGASYRRWSWIDSDGDGLKFGYFMVFQCISMAFHGISMYFNAISMVFHGISMVFDVLYVFYGIYFMLFLQIAPICRNQQWETFLQYL